MKALLTITCLLAITYQCVALEPASRSTTKPKIEVAADGFPSGHKTPEGAACDLARAFINCDDALFTRTCIRLYANGTGPTDYAKFRDVTIKAIQEAKGDKSRRGPKTIGKVFVARHLIQSGPVSYAYASFDFRDVMFVDVGVFLQDNKRSLNRTLVIKDRDGLWYVHPMPDASPLLSTGLKEESPSQQDFSEAYELK